MSSDECEVLSDTEHEDGIGPHVRSAVEREKKAILWLQRTYNAALLCDGKYASQKHLDDYERNIKLFKQACAEFGFSGGVQFAAARGVKPSLFDDVEEPTLSRRVSQIWLARLHKTHTLSQLRPGSSSPEIIDESETALDPMPKTVGAYYHAVIYFKFNAQFSNSQRIKELEFLEKSLCAYVPTETDEYFNTTTHYFSTAAHAIRFFRPAIVKYGEVSTISKDTLDDDGFKPHIHVVYKRRGNSGNGRVEGIWKRWGVKRRGSGLVFRASEEKVCCIHCLCGYLSQGDGRVLGAEAVPSPDPRIGCNNKPDREDAGKAHNLQCIDANEFERRDLEGKS